MFALAHHPSHTSSLSSVSRPINLHVTPRLVIELRLLIPNLAFSSCYRLGLTGLELMYLCSKAYWHPSLPYAADTSPTMHDRPLLSRRMKRCSTSSNDFLTGGKPGSMYPVFCQLARSSLFSKAFPHFQDVHFSSILFEADVWFCCSCPQSNRYRVPFGQLVFCCDVHFCIRLVYF